METDRVSLLLLLLVPLVLIAQARSAPHIVTPAAQIPISLERVSIRTELDGTAATTTVEMVFRNPNHRPVEGELRLPLRERQHVTGFAFDADGGLRKAGPLQSTRDDRFTLRLHPIRAGRTRTVLVTYSETLAVHSGQTTYRLPLEYGSSVGEFSISIAVRGRASAMRISGARDLLFMRSAGNEVRTERRNFQPHGELEVVMTLRSGELEPARSWTAHVLHAALLAAREDLALLSGARRVPVADLAQGAKAAHAHIAVVETAVAHAGTFDRVFFLRAHHCVAGTMVPVQSPKPRDA